MKRRSLTECDVREDFSCEACEALLRWSGREFQPLDPCGIELAAVGREEHGQLAVHGAVHRHAVVADLVRHIDHGARGVVEVVVVDPALGREATLALGEPGEPHLDGLVLDNDALDLAAVDVALALILDFELSTHEAGEVAGSQLHWKNLRCVNN